MRMIGVDVGGTFTDIVYCDMDSGEVAIHKVSTTPDDPSRAILQGVTEICAQNGVPPESVDYLLRGKTTATNAVLENKGALTGMVTNQGFRDIVHIARHQRVEHYSIQQELPWQTRPLSLRRHRKVVRGRLIPPHGEELEPLNEADVLAAARELKAEGVEAVAVCFLFSYLNPAHEEQARRILERELPGVFITTSSSVSPQFREFERSPPPSPPGGRALRRPRRRVAEGQHDGHSARLDGASRSRRKPAAQYSGRRMMATNRVDPITGAVIQGALENIAIEMGHKLMRMSYSSIIRESEDFGAALTDAQGNQLCECKMSTPLQSGPIPGYIRGVRARFAARGDVFRPGDVIMHNDPYGGASHGPDVAFCVPVFEGETLLGFSVTTAHHLDIGAHTPGSCGIVDAVDAYAEGLQFKALKVIDAGRRNEPLWHMIRDNIRISDLVRQYSHATVMAASADLMDYSERLMRAAIAKLPDGVYRATTYIDGFLDDPEPSRRDFAICVAITVAGDELTVDLTGAAPQAPDRPINMPFEGHRHQGAGRRRQPLPGRGRHARSRPRRSQRRRRLLRLQFRRHHDGQQNLSASQGLSAYRGSRTFRPGARIGPGVTAFRPGDRVAAFSQDAGGFAECCVVPTERLIAIPDAMALDAAAAFPIQALTAWHLLHNVSVTKPGDVILLHAIGGGLGLLATQLALKAGATVIGTVGARGKEARALESGASLVVNRNDEDFVEALMRFTGGRGVDKIVDSTGGDILDRSFGCIRRLGHVVSFGEAAGRPFANLWERLVANSLTFSRFHLGHVDFHGEAWKTNVNEVIADILAGRLIVRVEQVFAFAQAGSMLERLASRNVSGKLLLAMAPGLK